MKFDAESESVEKSEQKSPPKSCRPKTILHTVISQKLIFSVTFFVDNFFPMIFCNFSNGSEIRIKFFPLSWQKKLSGTLQTKKMLVIS